MDTMNHFRDYGATRKEHQFSSSTDEFNWTSYKTSSVDAMNDCLLIHKINEQTTLYKLDGNPVRAKIHLHHTPLRTAKKPARLRRKSEADLPNLKKSFEYGATADSLFENVITKPLIPPITTTTGLSGFSNRQILILITIAIIDFSTYGALSIMSPFFPNEATKKGVNTAMSGIVFSLYALVIGHLYYLFITSPFMGSIADKIGAKALLLSGIALAGICNVLFGLLHYVDESLNFFYGCLLVKAFEGLGASAYVTSGFTFVADIFPDQIGSVLGILEIFVGLGMSCGPAIGGLLYDWGGYGLPFYTAGGLLLIIIPMNICILPSSVSSTPPPPGSTWRLLMHKPVILMYIVVVVVSITWGFTEPTLEPHLRQFNLSAKHLGLFFLLAAAMYAFTSPAWGYVADRMELTWALMVVGLLLSSVGILLLGPSQITGLENSIWLNVLALTIIGISMSMALLPTFEAMLDFAIEDGHEDGTATYALIGGLWSSAYSLGDVIGPTLGAFITHHFGFPVCTTVIAGLCTFTAILVFIYFRFSHPVPGST